MVDAQRGRGTKDGGVDETCIWYSTRHYGGLSVLRGLLLAIDLVTSWVSMGTEITIEDDGKGKPGIGIAQRPCRSQDSGGKDFYNVPTILRYSIYAYLALIMMNIWNVVYHLNEVVVDLVYSFLW